MYGLKCIKLSPNLIFLFFNSGFSLSVYLLILIRHVLSVMSKEQIRDYSLILSGSFCFTRKRIYQFVGKGFSKGKAVVKSYKFNDLQHLRKKASVSKSRICMCTVVCTIKHQGKANIQLTFIFSLVFQDCSVPDRLWCKNVIYWCPCWQHFGQFHCKWERC